jgi:hypothetical protein
MTLYASLGLSIYNSNMQNFKACTLLTVSLWGNFGADACNISILGLLNCIKTWLLFGKHLFILSANIFLWLGSRSSIYPSSIIKNRFIGCLLVSSKPVGQQPSRQLQRFHQLASYVYRNLPLLKYAQSVDAQGYSNAIYSVSVYVTTAITA